MEHYKPSWQDKARNYLALKVLSLLESIMPEQDDDGCGVCGEIEVCDEKCNKENKC